MVEGYGLGYARSHWPRLKDAISQQAQLLVLFGGLVQLVASADGNALGEKNRNWPKWEKPLADYERAIGQCCVLERVSSLE